MRKPAPAYVPGAPVYRRPALPPSIVLYAVSNNLGADISGADFAASAARTACPCPAQPAGTQF